MHFGLNENQVILRDSAREFFAGECSMAFVRRAAESPTAYYPQLWTKLAAQGYTGVIVDEAHGGVGLGIVELVLLMEEAGRALLPGPLFATVAMAGAVLDACANPAHKHKYLAPIAHGDARSTLAFVEPKSGWDRAALQLTAKDGRLSGEKLFVPDAGVADTIVVVARDGVYIVEANAPGVSIAPMAGMDLTRKLYTVSLTDVAAEKLDAVAGLDRSLDRALDIATTALAAEMVGGMQRTLDVTVDYAKTRKQFGKPIGSFQAVQHQCADMYLETESARSAVYYAAVALQEGAADASAAVSIAKLYASDACRTVGNRGIQIHGGMGFTWENDLHLYYRRAKASETMLGDATFHRERLARLVVDAGRG